MTNDRKAEVFDLLIYYVVQTEGFSNTVDILLGCGMTTAEIATVLADHYPELSDQLKGVQ